MFASNHPIRPRFGKSRTTSGFKNAIFLRAVAFLMLIGFLGTAFYATSSGSSILRSSSPKTGKVEATLKLGNERGISGSYLRRAMRALATPVVVDPETIVVSPPATRAPGCTNPAVLCLGETVTAIVSNAPLRAGFRERRIQWVAPDGSVPQLVDVVTDPQTDTYTLPTSGPFAQVGKWAVRTLTNRFGAIGVTTFDVGDPSQPSADLAVSVTGPTSVTANTNVSYNVTVTNNGPDTADNITFNNPVPYNSTFVSASTPAGFTCTAPSPGEVGDISCTSPSLAMSASAAFSFVFSVNSDVKNGSAVYEWARADTTTNEPDQGNNVGDVYSSSPPGGGGGGTCTLDCPEDVNAIANTTEGSQRGAHVSFPPTTFSGDCGTPPVTTSPASGSFFPVGTTTVTSTSTSNGGSCSFTVTVEEQGTNPPSISCPSNPPAANANGNCEAAITIVNPTVTGNNVTFSGVRSDGKPMYNCNCFPSSPNQADDACNIHGACTRRADAPFGSGITTIVWTAYSHNVPGPYATPEDEEAARTGTASCTVTVTVNDVTPPSITPPANQTESADANCQFTVPDYTTMATVSDNCACDSNTEDCQGRVTITVTQSPTPGTSVGLGPHTITLTANDGSSNNDGDGNTATAQFTLTVNDTTAPVITCPADVLNVPTETGTCAAHVTTGTATATDNCDTTPTIVGTRSDGQPLTSAYPRGTTTIEWKATDDAGNHSSCTQTITVVDTEAPVIVLNGSAPSMWPPNHSYHTFGVTAFVTAVTDNCDTIGVSSVYITKVTSDENENGNGDGNTMNDIVIAADCKSVQLRSEREGSANGRVYTIFFAVRDTTGNVGTATATVVVRKNPSTAAVDSGPHYTVLSGCP
ncbi:MAG: HYR domain-containing protein [Acidobacteriota bacterium]